jgi:hypothetical protein
VACAFEQKASGEGKDSRRAQTRRLVFFTALMWIAAAGPAVAADVQTSGQSPWQPQARLSLSTGLDGNVRYAPPGGLDASVAGQSAQSAGFAALSLGVGVDGVVGPALEVTLEYELFQLAYPDRSLASYDFQEHAASLRLGQSGPWASWELAARADLSFTGVGTAVKPFQRSASLEPQVTLGRNQMVRLRVGGAYMAIETLDVNLSFLSGQRLEARLTPELSLAGWRLSLPLRWRRDWMGVARGEMILTEDPETCAACGVQSVTPFSNQAVAAGLRLSSPWRWPVRPGGFLRIERRTFLAAQYDDQWGADGVPVQVGSQTRLDDRLSGGASLTVPLAEHWSLGARYDYTQSQSTFVGAQAVSDPRRSYHKHAGSLELEVSWM